MCERSLKSNTLTDTCQYTHFNSNAGVVKDVRVKTLYHA